MHRIVVDQASDAKVGANAPGELFTDAGRNKCGANRQVSAACGRLTQSWGWLRIRMASSDPGRNRSQQYVERYAVEM
jgi:hypothetical protein